MGHNTCKSMGRLLYVVRRHGGESEKKLSMKLMKCSRNTGPLFNTDINRYAAR